MAKVTLNVPTLWADHHVLKVRDALVNLDGVNDVYASAAWKQILVDCDGRKIKRPALEKALADAGYPVGEGEVPVLAQPGKLRRDPQWADMNMRTTKTNMIDLEMSGEFRRY